MKLGVYSHVVGKVVAEPKKLNGLVKVRLHIGKDRKVGSIYEHRFMDLLFYAKNPLQESASKELKKGIFVHVQGQNVESYFDKKIFNELIPESYKILSEEDLDFPSKTVEKISTDDVDFEM